MNWIKFSSLALVFALSSCGTTVKYGLSGINILPNVKTVSVKLFENKATLVNPLLAQVYSEKLKEKFINQTSLAVVTENGDWSFEGAIVNYAVEPVNRQTIGGGTRNKLTIEISVKFIDLKNDIDTTYSFVRFKDFEATEDFASIESSLVDEITTALVQDVFNKTALTW